MAQGPSEHVQEEVQKEHDDPEIDKLLKDQRYYFFKKKIQRAVELLENERNAGELVKIVADALVAEKIKVFFSYKLKDKEKAEKIVTVLRHLTGGKLQITWAEDFHASDVRNERIRASILEAHWFILLLPDPSDEWDWCLFETGMFRGRFMSLKLNKIFCLHHYENERPEQIDEFLTVEVHPEKPSSVITKFLKPICTEEDFFPGMGQLCAVTEDAISNAAAKIVDAVLAPSPQPKRRRFEALVRIHLSNPHALRRENDLSDGDIENLRNNNEKVRSAKTSEAEQRAIKEVLTEENIKILNEATFKGLTEGEKGVNWRALEIFGKNLDKVPPNWEELVSNVTRHEADTRWLGELCFAIKSAVTGDDVKPVQATFTADNRAKSNVRPILYAVDEYPNGPIEGFFVVFVEDVGAPISETRSKVPIPDYLKLASSIHQGYRFRWEVVEPFKNISDRSRVMELKDAMDRVMHEYESRGQHKLDELAEIFKGKDGDKVQELYECFVTTLRDLYAAIKTEDTGRIKGLLTEFAPANEKYLKLSTKLFADMNAEL